MDLSHWDVSKVKDMSRMFEVDWDTSAPDHKLGIKVNKSISSWKVSRDTNLDRIFNAEYSAFTCQDIESILKSWGMLDLWPVTMFQGCE